MSDKQNPAGWDFSAEKWPERSVLQGRAPEYTGTGMVVSLAGYVIGLAWDHRIPPVELLHWIADAGSDATRPGRTRADYEAVTRDLLRKPRSTLIGPWNTGEIIAEALGRLTGREDIRSTTLLGWAPVLPTKRAFRIHRAYCPCCYFEWSHPVPSPAIGAAAQPPAGIYEPLLWQFTELEVCIRHGVKLRSACSDPSCRAKRGTLAAWARPGYCECGRFLGVAWEAVKAVEGDLDERVLNWQEYVTAALCDLIANPPAAGEVVSPVATSAAVQLAVERSTGGKYIRFADMIQMSAGTVSLWKDGRRRPTIGGALRICAASGFRLPDFLAGRVTLLELTMGPTLVPYIPKSTETHRVLDWNRVRRKLRAAVGQEVPPSLRSVRRDLRVDARQLSRLYPDECRLIRERHLQLVEDQSMEAQRHRQDLILAAIRSIHAEGRYPSRHQVSKLLPRNVSLRQAILNRLWKDELVRLGYPRPDKPRRGNLVA